MRNENAKWIQPIGVNNYKSEGVISDDSGLNISHLNASYCELTAQYWAWKNSDYEYIGFFHYRRYLNFTLDSTWNDGFAFATPANMNIINYLTSDNQLLTLNRILDFCDVVIPSKNASKLNIADHYKTHHIPEHWDFFIELLSLKFPKDEKYLDSFNLTNLNTVYNMFVMRKELFNSYCNELFPILDKVFQKFGLQYDSYNNRYIGFLAERFLNFWIYKNNLRYFEVPTLMLT